MCAFNSSDFFGVLPPTRNGIVFCFIQQPCQKNPKTNPCEHFLNHLLCILLSLALVPPRVLPPPPPLSAHPSPVHSHQRSRSREPPRRLRPRQRQQQQRRRRRQPSGPLQVSMATERERVRLVEQAGLRGGAAPAGSAQPPKPAAR